MADNSTRDTIASVLKRLWCGGVGAQNALVRQIYGADYKHKSDIFVRAITVLYKGDIRRKTRVLFAPKSKFFLI